MNTYTSGPDDPFLDLSAFDHVSAPVKSASSSIIKSSAIAETGIIEEQHRPRAHTQGLGDVVIREQDAHAGFVSQAAEDVAEAARLLGIDAGERLIAD